MKGKEKCKALKEIRRQIAEKNDIPYVVSQCKYQGDCLGTCPKCEAELRYLERELAIRQSLGKAAAVAGISVSVCASLTACASTGKGTAPDPDSGYEDISGDIEVFDPDYLIPETNDGKNENPDNDDISSPESEEDPEIAGKVERIDETEGIGETENPEETEEPIDTDMLTGDISNISIEDTDEFPANGL